MSKNYLRRYQMNSIYSVGRFLLITAVGITVSTSSFLLVPPAHASLQEAWDSFWTNLRGRAPQIPRRNGGGRGPDEVCPIAPVAIPDAALVWSEQPTFVWDGAVDKVAVRLQSSQAVIWEKSVDGLNHVTYSGEVLQPQVTYQWLIFEPGSDEASRVFPFQIMAAEERQQVDDLPEANLEEAVALERAFLFAEQGLWSDFWRELLSVEQPSDALDDLIEETITEICTIEQP